jgi:hypothetical protein
MITAKHIILSLNEAYYDRITVDSEIRDISAPTYRGDSVEVFVNPSQKELRDIPGEARFTAVQAKKLVYVWDSDFLHYEVHDQIGLPYNILFTTVLTGTAENKRGNCSIIESDSVRRIFEDSSEFDEFSGDVLSLLKEDWKWLEKYIKIQHYIEAAIDAIVFAKKSLETSSWKDTEKALSRNPTWKKYFWF